MARQGIWLVPTLSVTQRMKEHLDADPQSLPAYVAAKLPLVFDTQRRNFKYALEHGVKIAMGTDAGALGHGENGKELVYMVQAGMTPMQAVVASTKSAAELLGMQDALGTVEAGKLADLILVDGDPLGGHLRGRGSRPHQAGDEGRRRVQIAAAGRPRPLAQEDVRWRASRASRS